MIGAAGYAVAARQKHSVSFVATIRDLFPDDDDDDVPAILSKIWKSLER
jgi:hypothetical protein